ncbi:MAG TPA: hypothetical protein VE869_10755 [Gemmatimonas sp.]|nr:hypothetical protein [Gemmatimonas sp.]
MNRRSDLAFVRRASFTVACLSALAVTADGQRANRYAVDIGTGNVDWLSRGAWGPTVSVQARFRNESRLAVIAGLRGTFNLHSGRDGESRRDDVMTALLGLETPLFTGRRTTVHGSVSGAFSRYRSSYRRTIPSNVEEGAYDGLTWPSAIVGLRAEFLRDAPVRLSLRGDVRPRFVNRRTLNPTFGIGVTF